MRTSNRETRRQGSGLASGAKAARLKRPLRHDKPEAGDRLAAYHGKRDFEVTPEPRGAPPPTATDALEFVVQKHDATRLHYDVRIEIAGAMMSWAVPKGPSLDPAVKRLAIETEDHPMDYNRFEGRIPDGEYGAGDVLIWDRGTYETVPPGREAAMREKGHFLVRFFGEKLHGDFHFVRTDGRDADHVGPGAKTPWLMFKANDAYADAELDVVAARPDSVVSRKSATRGPRRVGPSPAGRSAKSLLAAVGAPTRAVPVATVADPGAYLYEVKYDGYRLLAARAGDDVRLVTRNRQDWTARFKALAEAVGRLSVREVVVDGEACLVDDRGVSSFRLLQDWLGGERVDATFVFAAFDLLWLDGRDLRGRPIEERRELLAALLKNPPPPLAFSASLPGALEETAKLARAKGLEGLIAKKRGSLYGSLARGAWCKLKFRKEQEVAIAGYIPMTGASDEIGALLLAVATKDGHFEFAGKVGTGFDRKTRKALAQRLERHHLDVPDVAGDPRVKGARWSKIHLVAQIAFSDELEGQAVTAKGSKPRVSSPAASEPGVPSPGTSGPAISNPQKVLFPRDAVTKSDVAQYYAAVADSMLPHLAGRPIGIQRWPNGIDKAAWFQQNAPEKVPGFVRVVDPGAAYASTRKIIVENAETLAWLANLAALTIHQWASHIPPQAHAASDIERALDQPDYTVIDLDPGDGTWDHVIKVARTLRGLLEGKNLTSVVKTSGQRIVIPFTRGPSHIDARDFAASLASAVANGHPDIATIERMKSKRSGRLYVDYLQNGSGKTIVAPYSLRARDGAPVSTPIQWSEVTRDLDPQAFNLRTVVKRLEKLGDLFEPALRGAQKLPAVARV